MAGLEFTSRRVCAFIHSTTASPQIAEGAVLQITTLARLQRLNSALLSTYVAAPTFFDGQMLALDYSSGRAECCNKSASLRKLPAALLDGSWSVADWSWVK